MDMAEVAVGLLLLHGAVWKIAHLREFRAILLEQAGLVARWSTPLRVAVPSAEVLLAAGAVAAGLAVIPLPLVLGQTMFAVVMLAHTLRQWRRRDQVRCGCLGGTESFGPATAVRAMFVLAVSVAFLILPGGGAEGIPTTLAGAVVLYLIITVGLGAIFPTSTKTGSGRDDFDHVR